eukprot:m.3011 g.3011  ORF g.3011 m.3011 type:complete len:243 (+) comp9006_c0_seq1:1581-2309(+)
MTLQWTLVAFFLYGEVALVALLCIPIISARRWNRIFSSSLLNWIAVRGNLYFLSFILILVLFFADAVNQIRKYDEEATDGVKKGDHLDTRTFNTMLRFRSQRNLYISGFALLLLVVLRRMVSLLCKEARLEASHEAAMSQANHLSEHAKKLMDQNEQLRAEKLNLEEGKTSDEDTDEVDVKDLQEEVERLKKEKGKLESDAEAARKQAEGVSMEYDRLMSEHSTLQTKLSELEGEDESKKDQ